MGRRLFAAKGAEQFSVGSSGAPSAPPSVPAVSVPRSVSSVPPAAPPSPSASSVSSVRSAPAEGRGSERRVQRAGKPSAPNLGAFASTSLVPPPPSINLAASTGRGSFGGPPLGSGKATCNPTQPQTHPEGQRRGRQRYAASIDAAHGAPGSNGEVSDGCKKGRAAGTVQSQTFSVTRQAHPTNTTGRAVAEAWVTPPPQSPPRNYTAPARGKHGLGRVREASPPAKGLVPSGQEQRQFPRKIAVEHAAPSDRAKGKKTSAMSQRCQGVLPGDGRPPERSSSPRRACLPQSSQRVHGQWPGAEPRYINPEPASQQA